MSNIANNPIQGVIFDYGGTIDTDAMHWAEVLWGSYQGNQVPVDKESFRQATKTARKLFFPFFAFI